MKFAPEVQEDAFKAVCNLNKLNHLKTGGRFPKNEVKPADSTSLGDPNVWFSWMPWNYDEVCSDLREVLSELGFDVYESSDKTLLVESYDGKIGGEDLFFEALAPYVSVTQDNPEPYMEWEGEGGERWRWVFSGGKMRMSYSTITWS